MSLAAEHRPPCPGTGEPGAGESEGAAALPTLARAAIRARARSETGDLDYVRALQQWFDAGATQTEIANTLGVTQAAISRMLSRHRGSTLPLSGFAGATPLEVCKRYAAGELSRAELVDQLTRFPYAPTPAASTWDDLVVDPPGAWSELEIAKGLRLIDASIYEDVFLALHPQYLDEDAAQDVVDDGGDDRGGDRAARQVGDVSGDLPSPARSSVRGTGSDGENAAPST